MAKTPQSFSKSKKLILLILIVILLISARIYLDKPLFLDKATTSIPARSIREVTLPTWNKYQGFGFTFEYPANWKVEEINSWTKHEYLIYDPVSVYEKDYKGVAKSQFYSRTWDIMVLTEQERKNYLENDKLLSPAEYAKFYCKTQNHSEFIIITSSPQNGKNAFQAKCFTVTSEYLIYNDNFFAKVLTQAYGGTEHGQETISRFLPSIKISE